MFKAVLRLDTGLIEYMWEDENGFLRGDGYATRFGVFTYVNPDGSLRKELRHPADVLKLDSMRTMEMLPLTNDHPSELVTSDNAKQFQVGYTGENVRPDGIHIVTPIVVTDKSAVQEIYNGKHQLSLGYVVDLIEETGEYDGVRYDFRQTNIRYNHLAIVGQARAGNEAKLKFDGAEIFAVMQDVIKPSKEFKIDKEKKSSKKKDNNNNQPNKRSDSMIKVLVRGINYDAAPEVGQAITDLTIERDNLKTKVQKATDANTELTTKLAASEKLVSETQGKLDAEIKKDRTEEIKNAAIKRKNIVDSATKILDAKELKELEEKSDIDIVKAGLVKKFPKEKFDDQKEDYLMARWDGVVASLSDTKAGTSSQRSISTPNFDSTDEDGDEKVDNARADMMKKMAEGSEDKTEK